jgi:ATP-dependent exoDNAse (exonuclease V) beta subunit
MCAFFINYLIAHGLYKDDVVTYELGKSAKLSSNRKHEDSTKTISTVAEVLHPKDIKIAKRESIMWGTHQQEAIEYGNVIHEILSFIETKKDVNTAIAKALEEGLIQFSQREIVHHTLISIVEHERLANYFSEGNQVMNEQTIIQKAGRVIQPDRIVIREDKKVFLLDYKTGVPNSKYKTQLNNYQDAIEDMGYQVVEKAIIYIGDNISVISI